MTSLSVVKFLLAMATIILVSNLNCVSSFHLDNSLVNSTLSVSVNESRTGNTNTTSSKNINISSITNQLQTTLQSLLNSLNSTSSSGIGSILGIFTNLTSSIKPSGGGGGKFRVENFVENVTELLRNSTESMKRDPLVNLTSLETVEKQVQGALREFERSILQLTSSKSSNDSSNATFPVVERRSGTVEGGQNGSRNFRKNNGFRRVWDQLSTIRDQMDSTMQQSLANARSRLEDSMSLVSRQGPQIMRNQTVGFMGEIQKMFASFSEPFRQFFEGMRKRLPTSVVNA